MTSFVLSHVPSDQQGWEWSRSRTLRQGAVYRPARVPSSLTSWQTGWLESFSEPCSLLQKPHPLPKGRPRATGQSHILNAPLPSSPTWASQETARRALGSLWPQQPLPKSCSADPSEPVSSCSLGTQLAETAPSHRGPEVVAIAPCPQEAELSALGSAPRTSQGTAPVGRL